MRKSAGAIFLAVCLGLAGPTHAVEICGDVNDSGSVSATDALLVLRKGVGQDVPLQCGPFAQPLITGQKASHGPGSDGDLEAGIARSFTDNGDGTITDHATGLMWEKKDRAGGSLVLDDFQEDAADAWRVNFFAGAAGVVKKINAITARAVRGPL